MNKEQKDTVFRVVVFGIIVLAMFVYLIAGAIQTPTTPETYSNSYSTSPGGHSALAELLDKNGYKVKQSVAPLPGLSAGADNDWLLSNPDTIALIEPNLSISEDFQHEFVELMEMVRTEDTRVLLALPKRGYELKRLDDNTIILEEYFHSLDEADDLFQETPLARFAVIKRDGDDQTLDAPEFEFGQDVKTKVKFPRQYFELTVDPEDPMFVDHVEILLTNEKGKPVAMRYRRRVHDDDYGLIVLADPDILTNRYIKSEGAADLSLLLFQTLNESGNIHIDESSHGFASDASIEYLALTPPGLWVTLALFLTLLVWAWRQSTVMRPANAITPSRGQRKYAIEALGRMMLRARDHGSALIQFRRRGKLVLSSDRTSVRQAGMGEGSAVETDTSTYQHYVSGNTEQSLIDAANEISQQLRTG
ncbi:MAG: DUF4350 domain-containing protein, partial [Planctomycetes bacterium]|nr:DUF4350 domain-containing protein [Planctomycetota bacterium]